MIEEWTAQVVSLVSDNLYPGIFAAAFAETVFPPIPSEVIFPLAGYTILHAGMPEIHILGAGVAGGGGATAGGAVIFAFSRLLGRAAVVRAAARLRVGESGVRRAESWFERHGERSVLFGRLVPGVRSLVSVPAGILAMRPAKFVAYTFIGSCAWSTALVAAGYYLGAASVSFW